MADTSKPVSGFRFNPFDQELISDYLKPMIMGQQLPCNIIKFRQVYGPTSHAWRVFDPNEHNSWLVAPHLKDTEKVMFVFAKLSKLSKGGACKNYSKRAGCGTWVGKTKRDQIRDGEGHVIGEKRYLVYEIKEAVGVGFDFSKVGYYKMHEYSLSGVNQGLDGAGSIVLCKITYDSSKKCPVALMSGSKIADHDSTSGSVVCKTPSDSSKRCPIALMSGTKIADHDTTTSTSVLCETASDSSEECPITLKSVTKNIADHDTTTSTVLCTFDSSRELPITLMSGTKIADDVSTSTSSEAQEEEENYKNLEGMGIGSVTENPIVIDDVAEANSPISVMDSGGLDDVHEVRFSCVQGTSFRVVNVIDDSGESGYSDGYEFRTRRVLNGNANSGTLGLSGSHDNSHELSRNSDVEGVSDGPGEGLTLDFDKPGSRSPVLSSEITSCEEEDSVHEVRSPHHRTPIVTFRDPELTDIVHAENDHVETVVVQEKQRSKSSVKKGLCHLCLKGNRFTAKEACLVCSAKYCYKCVLRAMGSMPEGRKCITCIGYRIDESNRASLGKSSRLLRRLHVNIRAKEIMRHEISCKANQFPPELIYVNGRSLSEAELVELLCCPNPPRKLEPIKYWYDKVSGLWGKEGRKPCQVISAQLSVGGQIMQNASNGNTNILVNNREITKSELWMLELAGINCEGKPHFWMSADGSFQEEGQKNVMKQKLNTPTIKLLSAIFSLPIPSEAAHSGIEQDDKVASKTAAGNLEQRKPYKFLMVGSEKSGTSTIFKQAKILYNAPFSEDERQEMKSIIQSKLYTYIGNLLEDRERFEEESLNKMRIKHTDQIGLPGTQNTDQIGEENIYSINQRLRAFSDWLLQVMMSGNLEAIFPASTREYSPLVEELWKDKAIQATYNQENELQMLPQGVNYFLNRAVEISRAEYEPSDIDILYAEGITFSNGIASVEFTFPNLVQDSYMDTTDHNDPLKRLRYQLIRVNSSSLGKNCKWLEMFEEVDLIIYCVSLTDYCQFSYDTNGVATNNMLKSRNLFETIVNHPISTEKDFLLILTKFDLLEEMIEQVPLTHCEWFHDFNPVLSSNPNSNISNNFNASLAQRAFHYIASKFKEDFYSLTGNRLYVSRVSGLEADSVDEALKYAREILNWDYEKPTYNMNEWSSGSVEISSSS